jgi:hypothetical protein
MNRQPRAESAMGKEKFEDSHKYGETQAQNVSRRP